MERVFRRTAGVDEPTPAVAFALVGVGQVAVVVQGVAVGKLGAPERGHFRWLGHTVTGRQQQVGKGGHAAHFGLVGVAVGRIPPHVVGQQVAGQWHVLGGALVIAGVEHL